MHISETLIGGNPDLYEQRYSLQIGNSELPVVRRPLAIEPPEGTICFVDDGARHTFGRRRTAGHYKGGKWLRVRFEPTHWTIWEDKPGE